MAKKQSFGKDENGTFHPGKGKPSGINKEEGLGLQATDPDKINEYIEISEKYTIGEDELDPSVPMRHKNRNTSKGEDTYKGKENKEQSDKTTNESFTEERAQVVAEELPGILTKDVFTELANYKSDCCISLFLGAHKSGVEVNEHYDPVNFKSQLQEITTKLKDKGHNQAFIEKLLEPGYELIRNDEFWTKQSPGLAVFIADGFFKYIRMPAVPAEEILVIEPTFYVTPLIPLMTNKDYFYLLAISKQSAKLFKADAFGMQIVPLELPQSIDEVKRLADSKTFRSGESGRRAPSASQPGSVHGAGGGNPGDKDNMLTYFEAVDDILWEKVFNKENAPLLLAGVEYVLPIYRNAADYHNVWPDALTGNRDHQETNSLYNDAMQVMKPYFEQKVNKALETYRNNSASGLTSSIAADVIPAAYYSQVSHLFVTKGEHIWGTFDEMSNELQFHDTPDEDGEDLIDNAVVKTLANGGEVFLIEKDKMPADCQIAALMRF